MSKIRAELERIYGPQRDGADEVLEDFDAPAVQRYRTLPPDLRAIAEHIVAEDAFPHPRVRTLWGICELIEWNEDDGTFGQLRHIEQGYPYDDVVMIGPDTFLDVKGQVATAGSVVWATGYDLDGAEVLAESLLALLEHTERGPDGGVVWTPPRDRGWGDVSEPAVESAASPSRSAPANVEWTTTSRQTWSFEGLAISVDVPVGLARQAHATGFVAADPSASASVSITGLPNLDDASGELKVAAMFDKETARSEGDGDGGTVTTPTATTRLMRAGSGFVRCYVKGGTAEARSAVCRSLRVEGAG